MSEREIEMAARLLIVDEDCPSLRQLSKAMAKRGFNPILANSVAEAIMVAASNPPAFAIVELRLPDGHGLNVVRRLCDTHPECRVIVLTSFGSIASAVAAVKIGAVDYLAKPATADQVFAALLPVDEAKPPRPEKYMSPDRVRWEHINRIYELCDHNKCLTADKLNIHRRTLQRILSKEPPQ